MKYILQPELTNKCNYACKLCPHAYYKVATPLGNKYDRPEGFMSEELYKIVLENAAKYAKSMCFGFFGEPLLHPNFKEFVDMVPIKRSYKLELNTNFSLFTEDYIETFKKFDEVKISLDASSLLMYGILCPTDYVLDMEGFKRDGIYLFRTLEDKIRYWLSLKKSTETRIVYVISEVNRLCVDEFVEKWQPYLGKDDHILTKSVLSYGGIVTDEYMTENKCKILSQNWMIVGWNGDCSPCNLDVNLELNIGNLLTNRDLSRILVGKNVLDTIKNKKGICAKCFDANNWTKNHVFRRNK